jgi:2-keto-3-deoxy-L-rhamnonate aldolase RhmA
LKADRLAVRYPPRGVRGVSSGSRGSAFGIVPNYWHRIGDHIGVIVQIETRSSCEQIDAICAVDGVDAVFVGPHDLAASIGHLVDTQHDDVQALIRGEPDKCKRLGKAAGILAASVEEAKRYAG